MAISEIKLDLPFIVLDLVNRFQMNSLRRTYLIEGNLNNLYFFCKSRGITLKWENN